MQQAKPESREDQKKHLREMALIAERITGKKCKKCEQSGLDGWITNAKQYAPCVCVVSVVNKLEDKQQAILEKENQKEIKPNPIISLLNDGKDWIREKNFRLN